MNYLKKLTLLGTFLAPLSLQAGLPFHSLNQLWLAGKNSFYGLFAPASFEPTLANLNTVTFGKIAHAYNENLPSTTATELALTICDNYDTMNSSCLSINNNHEVKGYCTIEKGITFTKEDQDKELITLYSKGFCQAPRPTEPSWLQKTINHFYPAYNPRGLPKRGGGALRTYASIRDNLIHTPCITFDYPDLPSIINMAQTLDLQCLNTIINRIPSNKKVIYMGTSRGATTLLKNELLHSNQEKHRCPEALVLESPFVSIREVTDEFARIYCKNMPGSAAASYALAQRLYPYYKPAEDNLMDLIAQVNPNLPIFIVHLKEIDYFVSDKSIFNMVNKLSQYNTQNLYFLVLTDPTKRARHGDLNQVKAFQQALNAFYKKYGLPYNEQLAQEGENMLTIAKNNSSAASIQEWDLTPC